MDASPDVQEISRNITNRSISEPASPTPPTKSNSARRENLNVKSEISIKSSSDKDAVIDQLKERVIALARTSFFISQDSSGFSPLFHFVSYCQYQAFSHPAGVENPHKKIRREGICSLELSRRGPISLRRRQRQRYTRAPC